MGNDFRKKTALNPSGKKVRHYVAKMLYLASVTTVLYVLFSNWAYDDPFITYRYADNLLRGVGFLYNPGERVLSTTTPLFALLLNMFGRLWSDLPHLANLLGSFGIALGGIFLWELGRNWEYQFVGWAGLLLYPTFPLLVSTLGSETPLYLAFCLGTILFYAQKKYLLAGSLAGFTVLTRGDGALVPLLLGLDFIWRLLKSWKQEEARFHLSDFVNRIPLKGIFLFFVVILPWFVFAWGYFGSPLPATLATKQHQGSMAISQRFAPGLLSVIGWYTSHWQYYLEAVLAVVGLVSALIWNRLWLLILAWTVLYFAAYSLLGVTRYFWYYAPLVPGFIVLVGLGSGKFHRWLGWWGSRLRFPKRLSKGITIIIILVLAFMQSGDLLEMRKNADTRSRIYRVVGEWLQANTSPRAKVGALEVGIIGYYAKRPMVDFAGLIQPNVANQLTVDTTYQDAAIWASNRYQPDYLVLFRGAFPRLRHGYVAERCRLMVEFPATEYGFHTDLQVYACRSGT